MLCMLSESKSHGYTGQQNSVQVTGKYHMKEREGGREK